VQHVVRTLTSLRPIVPVARLTLVTSTSGDTGTTLTLTSVGITLTVSGCSSTVTQITATVTRVEPKRLRLTFTQTHRHQRPTINISFTLDWIEQCFTSTPTQYRLYGRRFSQVKRPNQQYQSTEGTSLSHSLNTNQPMSLCTLLLPACHVIHVIK